MAQSNPVTSLPGTGAKAVVKSDTTVFPPSLIYVGGTGDVAVMPADQAGAAAPASVIFSALPAGVTVPVLCIQVLSTGTTATLMTRVS